MMRWLMLRNVRSSLRDRSRAAGWLVVSTALATGWLVEGASCRWQSSTPTTESTGEFGGAGTTYTAQCSGDFPDWITLNNAVPPGGDANPNEPGTQKPFQLAQSYPLGTPVFVTNNGQTTVDHWDPPAPNHDAPWRAFTNLSNATQRTNYLDALKAYILAGMSDPGIDFDATKNNGTASRRWFHVPMMTAAGAKRREPYHGVTAERALRPSDRDFGQPGKREIRSTEPIALRR